MIHMHRRVQIFLSVSVLLLGFLSLTPLAAGQQSHSNRGRKYKSPPPTARVEVTVVRDSDGKPIENAAVIFHMIGDKGNMELKSDDEGKAVIDVLPIGGAVQLQIIATGYKTYGEDYKIDQTPIAIAVRMKRPGEQYSIYKPHPDMSEGGKSPDAAKPADPPTGTATAPADKDKPADDPKPQPPPSQSQPK